LKAVARWALYRPL